MLDRLAIRLLAPPLAALAEARAPAGAASIPGSIDDGSDTGGIRREPAMPDHEAVVPEQPMPSREFAVLEDEPDDDAVRVKAMRQRFGSVARQAALDPDDGLPL